MNKYKFRFDQFQLKALLDNVKPALESRKEAADREEGAEAEGASGYREGDENGTRLYSVRPYRRRVDLGGYTLEDLEVAVEKLEQELFRRENGHEILRVRYMQRLRDLKEFSDAQIVQLVTGVNEEDSLPSDGREHRRFYRLREEFAKFARKQRAAYPRFFLSGVHRWNLEKNMQHFIKEADRPHRKGGRPRKVLSPSDNPKPRKRRMKRRTSLRSV